MLSEKIMVVDDDSRVIRSIKVGLAEYEIIDFSNAQDALNYLRKPHEINLILMDVMMPGMNGVNALHEVKKINKNIAVIMLTAYGSMDIAVQALRYQASDFLEKPFELEELKHKIHTILKNNQYLRNEPVNSDNKITRIKRFIERNQSQVSLKDIANELCLSPKYISRMFNDKHGSTFREYKLKIKMDIAKSLLKNSSYNINEISLQLGYQNAESFMRIFKRIEKKTPMEYRNHIAKEKTLKNKKKRRTNAR